MWVDYGGSSGPEVEEVKAPGHTPFRCSALASISQAWRVREETGQGTLSTRPGKTTRSFASLLCSITVRYKSQMPQKTLKGLANYIKQEDLKADTEPLHQCPYYLF